MKDLFVSYKIALKLKELGFEEYGFGYYRTATTYEDKSLNEWNLIMNEHKPHGFINGGGNILYAPLYQQVIDWLREKHGIHIEITKGGHLNKYNVFIPRSENGWIYINGSIAEFDYYDALNKAIEEALKLI